MSRRATNRAFAALSGAVFLASGCGIDEALVGGDCAEGYVRCGDRCCFAEDGASTDGTQADGSNDAPTGDRLPGDVYSGEGGMGEGSTDATLGDSSNDAASGDSGEAEAGGSTGCPAPLMECGGSCTDISSDSQNCGVCFNMCPQNEICVNGACGQLTGGVVYIGGDFATPPSPSQRQVLLNATNLASTSPIRVLSYEQYAQPKAIAQLDSFLTAPTYTMTHSSAPTVVTQPGFTLQSYGVLLVHDQALAPGGSLAGLGKSWKTALTTYVADGGVVIILDGGTSTTDAGGGTGEMPEFATATGLLRVGAHALLTVGTQVDLSDKNDAVGVKFLHPFDMTANAVSLTTEVSSQSVAYVITVLKEGGVGPPVVVHKTF